MWIAADGRNGVGGTVLPALGRGRLVLGLAGDTGNLDPGVLLLVVAPLRHGVQGRQGLIVQHAAPGGTEVQKLEDVGRRRCMEVVQPRRPRRRWGVARGGRRRTRAQRRACRGASVPVHVTAVPSVGIAQ